MKRRKIIGLTLSLAIAGSFCLPGLSAFADQFNVMSIGANLTAQQKQEMVTYFNAKPGSYEEVTIDNQQEQQELRGIIPESEIGTRTISCAFVQPTQSGGINVKTANLTYVTASMISNALTTAGIYNANVIAAAPFQVSGTGALTGIMESFEKATGQTISPAKKELANKELQVTSNIASNPKVGQDKAAAVVNQVKSDVVENGEKDQSQIATTINNVTNNYGVSLTPQEKQALNDLMQGIGSQNYNKNAMEKSLDKIQDQLNKVLDQQGQLKGMMNKVEVHFDEFVNWVEGIFHNKFKDAGIVNQTNNDSNIGKTAVTTGNSTAVQGAPDVAQQSQTGSQTNNSSINVVNSSDTNVKTTEPTQNSSATTQTANQNTTITQNNNTNQNTTTTNNTTQATTGTNNTQNTTDSNATTTNDKNSTTQTTGNTQQTNSQTTGTQTK